MIQTMKEELDRCYDIPLLESLQNLMEMEVVRDQVRTCVCEQHKMHP